MEYTGKSLLNLLSLQAEIYQFLFSQPSLTEKEKDRLYRLLEQVQTRGAQREQKLPQWPEYCNRILKVDPKHKENQVLEQYLCAYG